MNRHNILKHFVALASAAALVLAAMGTAMAAPDPQASERTGLFGDVVRITGDTLVVRAKQGDVQVTLNKDTKYRTSEGDAALADLSPGDRVAALVERSGEKTVAIAITFVPTKGKVAHVTGVVAEVSGGVAMLATEDGKRVTVEFGLNVEVPEVGTLITVVGRQNAATGVVTVTSVQKLSQTLERLKGHIEKADEDMQDSKEQLKNVARTKDLLESLSTRQLKIVNTVLDKLPENARGALDRAVRNVEEANRAVEHALDQAMTIASRDEREKGDLEKRRAQQLLKEAQPTIDDIAVALGMSRDDLLKKVSAAGSFSKLLQAMGVSQDALKEKVVAIVVKRLQAMADDGRLTKESVALIIVDVKELAANLLAKAFTEDEASRLDLPFSVEDLASVFGFEPQVIVALLHEGRTLLEIGAKAGITKDALIQKLMDLAKQRAQKLVESGALKPEDVSKYLEKTQARLKEFDKASPLLGKTSPVDAASGLERPKETVPANAAFDLVLVARILGVSQDDLMKRLKQGGALADVIQQSGGNVNDVADKLLAPVKEKLDALVAAKQLDAEKARKLLEEARDRLLKSLREFKAAALVADVDRDGKSDRAASSRLYGDIPVTLEDLAKALGVTVEELRKWMASEGGLQRLLKERGIDPEKVTALLLEVAKKRLDELVAKGELTKEKADRLLAELKQRLLGDLKTERTGPIRIDSTPAIYLPFDVQLVAKSLGMSPDELRKLLASGTTVSEIAGKRGVAIGNIVQNLMEPLAQDLREAVANKRITDEDAKKKLEAARESLQRALVSFRQAVKEQEKEGQRGTPPFTVGNDAPEVNIQTVARVLGLGPDELLKLLAGGTSLEEIARKQGLKLDDVVSKLMAPVEQKLRDAVRGGAITEEQSKQLLQRAREVAAKALEEMASRGAQEPSKPPEVRVSSTPVGTGTPAANTANKAPVAVAGPDQSGVVGQSFVLDGTRSQDDGKVTTFKWTQVEGPKIVITDSGVGIVINEPGGGVSSKLTITPTVAGTYVFELVVVDDRGLASQPVRVVIKVAEKASATPTTTTTAANKAPVAVAGPDQSGVVGQIFVLDGTRSQDDGKVTAFKWTQVEGTRIVITDPGVGKITIVPTVAGTYVFELVVVDNLGLVSQPVRVVIKVAEKTSASGTP